MLFRLLRVVLCIGLFGFGVMASPVHAQDHNAARDAVRSGKALPLKQILPRVRQRVPGRVLDARLRGGSRLRYELKVLGNKNVVRTVTVDAQSGAILGVK